jgi:hypothetical protein
MRILLCSLAAALLSLVGTSALAATPSPSVGRAFQSAEEKAAGKTTTLSDAAAHGESDFGSPRCKVIGSWARCGYAIDVSKGDAYIVAILSRTAGCEWTVIHHPGLTAAMLNAKYGVPMSVAVQLLPPHAAQ